MAEFHLETDRLVLRAWRESDVDPFMERLDTPEVTRWIDGQRPRAHYVELQCGMSRMQAELGHCFWIMESRADGGILGFCGPRLAGHPGTPVHGELELGWRLCARHWGRGYAKEAARAAIAWCWTNLPQHDRIIAYTVLGNTASWGLMRGLDMARREEMDFDHPAFPVGHRLCRHISYALERPA
jgi:RimJ/RimL family protein N-acetyltransferase